jgi:hypothetical protein
MYDTPQQYPHSSCQLLQALDQLFQALSQLFQALGQLFHTLGQLFYALSQWLQTPILNLQDSLT